MSERHSMRKIREVLRLRFENGLSHRAISASAGLSKGAVHEYLARAHQAALDWETARGLSEDEVERRLFQKLGENEPPQRASIDFAWVHRELTGLASQQSSLASSLLSAGQAYDGAGSSDAAALASWNAGNVAWNTTYQAAFVALDRGARYVEAQSGTTLTPLTFDATKATHDTVRARATTAQALAAITSTQASALTSLLSQFDAAWGTGPPTTAAPSPTQPGTVGALQSALAVASDFSAMVSYS